MSLEISNNNIYKNLYDGKWESIPNIKFIEITSPVDGSLVGKIEAMTKDDVDKVVTNSKSAEKVWSETPISKRAEILHKAADLLEASKSELSDILQIEIAKDRKSCLSEISRTVDFIKFTADEGKHMEGETIGADNFPGFNNNKLSLVTRVPVGTVLAISPFNYPINLSASKIAPALIAGNCVILKPPTQGAISALHLADIFNKAGLPPGVLNTVTGQGSSIGDYIVKHKDINFINFTGSTEVGKHIAEIAGMVPMLMELGGKDAALVLEDADLEAAAKNIVQGAYSYSGQRCTAVKRVIAIDSIADELVEKLKDKVEKLKVGMPHQDVDITPLINSKAADFVEGLIQEALDKNAKLILGNKRNGNLLYPTLIDNVTLDMRLAWEEPFGPVLPIIRVSNIDEAIEIANQSEYGLQSSVFTTNINKAFYTAKKLEVGTVQINNKTERGPDHFPFTGFKSSGLGTQGIRYSIEAMSRIKSIVLTIEG
ncbi:MAG: NADP-dependent glyceraldehyde-3-phosphate dehydrogenase [Bacillota bacterium]|nr:NADP-dependent glyceraldehyde-3-phosphate dehydrogenase [Bacillota bacterium]